MEALCMCQFSWFKPELGTGGGRKLARTTRDCPKPTILIRIMPIISLPISLPWPPSFPASSYLRIKWLPPAAPFLPHSSITTFPLSEKQVIVTSFSSVASICCEWSFRVDFRKSIFKLSTPIYVHDHLSVARVTATVITTWGFVYTEKKIVCTRACLHLILYFTVWTRESLWCVIWYQNLICVVVNVVSLKQEA